MSALYLELQTYAGAPIDRAIDDACRVAHALSIPVQFTHNDIRLFAHPNDSPDRVFRKWQSERDAAPIPS